MIQNTLDVLIKDKICFGISWEKGCVIMRGNIFVDSFYVSENLEQFRRVFWGGKIYHFAGWGSSSPSLSVENSMEICLAKKEPLC